MTIDDDLYIGEAGVARFVDETQSWIVTMQHIIYRIRVEPYEDNHAQPLVSVWMRKSLNDASERLFDVSLSGATYGEMTVICRDLVRAVTENHLMLDPDQREACCQSWMEMASYLDAVRFKKGRDTL